MGFTTIPALPGDYPLFRWSDWQASRDALVAGGKTRHFQKEAWNAIADKLADALTTAGEAWDSSVTTVQGARITAADRKLYAAKFNSIRWNIDRQMHMDWPWAADETYRGYVGREDFLGRQDAGKACDLVYPEYILDLVSRLNLLLEIMRGTGPVCDTAFVKNLITAVDAQARAGAGARVDLQHNSATQMDTSGARSAKSVSAAATPISRARLWLDIRLDTAANVSHSRIVSSLVDTAGRARTAMQAEPKSQLMHSAVTAAALATHLVAAAPNTQLMHSSSHSEAKTGAAIPASPSPIPIRSANSVAASKGQAFPGEAQIRTRSAVDSELKRGRALILPVSAPISSAVSAELRRGAASRIDCARRSGTDVECNAADTCWLPPVWVSGGLWVRQVHDAPVQRENGDLEVT